MNTKCTATIGKIIDVVDDLNNGLSGLVAAIEAGDEEGVDEAVDSIPSPKKVVDSLEKLKVILETRPWESAKKGKK